MEICQNKQSHKYFICLEKFANGTEALFINPMPRIIRLPLTYFENFIEEEEEALLSNGLITDAQLQLYLQNMLKERPPRRTIGVESKEVTHRIHIGSAIGRYIQGKKFTQEDLIPLVVLVLGARGGRATKQHVEETLYEFLRDEFHKDVYQQKVANYTVPRWKHDIAWARERAKQIHGFIKPATKSGNGIWELTDKGMALYDKLNRELKITMKLEGK